MNMTGRNIQIELEGLVRDAQTALAAFDPENLTILGTDKTWNLLDGINNRTALLQTDINEAMPKEEK